MNIWISNITCALELVLSKIGAAWTQHWDIAAINLIIQLAAKWLKVGFTGQRGGLHTLFKMVHNWKLMNCLFMKFST